MAATNIMKEHEKNLQKSCSIDIHTHNYISILNLWKYYIHVGDLTSLKYEAINQGLDPKQIMYMYHIFDPIKMRDFNP